MSASIGLVGVSLSLGVAVATNTIANTVESYITGETINAALNYSTSGAPTQVQTISDGTTVLVGPGYDSPTYSVANALVTLGHGQIVLYNGKYYEYLGSTETGVDIGNVATLQLPAQSNATWSILTTGTAFNYSVLSGLVTVTAGQIVETTDGSLYRYTGSTPLTNFDLGAQTSPGLGANNQWALISGTAGDTYKYVGTANPTATVDLNNQNYNNTADWQLIGVTITVAQDLSPPNQYAVTHAEGAASQVANVQTGDTVTLTGYGAGTSNGAVYEYTGPTTSLDLNSQNYTASSNWELVSYTIQSGDTVTLTGYGAGTSPGDVYSTPDRPHGRSQQSDLHAAKRLASGRYRHGYGARKRHHPCNRLGCRRLASAAAVSPSRSPAPASTSPTSFSIRPNPTSRAARSPLHPMSTLARPRRRQSMLRLLR